MKTGDSLDEKVPSKDNAEQLYKKAYEIITAFKGAEKINIYDFSKDKDSLNKFWKEYDKLNNTLQPFRNTYEGKSEEVLTLKQETNLELLWFYRYSEENSNIINDIEQTFIGLEEQFKIFLFGGCDIDQSKYLTIDQSELLKKGFKDQVKSLFVNRASYILGNQENKLHLPKCVKEHFEENLENLINLLSSFIENAVKMGEKIFFQKEFDKNFGLGKEEDCKQYKIQRYFVEDSTRLITSTFVLEWEKQCIALLKEAMEGKIIPFYFASGCKEKKEYSEEKYKEFIECILSLIRNSKRTFPTEAHIEDFTNINVAFIESIPKIDTAKEIEECRQYLGVKDNRTKRKNAFKNALEKYHKIELEFIKDEQIFAIFSILLGLSGTYTYDKNCKPIDQFKNRHYQPIAREVSRKIMKHLMKINKTPNSEFYSLQKLLIFEDKLGQALEDEKNNIKKIKETFVDEKFLFNKTEDEIDLRKWLTEIHKMYKSEEAYLKLLKRLMQALGKDPNNAEKELFHLMDAAKLLEIQRICDKKGKIPTNRTSRHATFCVSGFLSEKDDIFKDWKELIKYFPHSQVFNIHWKSTYWHFFPFKTFTFSLFAKDKNSKPENCLKIVDSNPALFRLKSNEIDEIRKENQLPTSQLTPWYHSVSYDEATENANNAAPLLALSIAIGGPIHFQSISFASFSLGTHFVTKCLCYLQQLNCINRIHDSIFLGGAAQIDVKDTLYKESFETVRGKVFNCWSCIDLILKTLHLFYDENCPIGKYKFQMNYDDQHKTELIIYRGKNFLQSHNFLNHIMYRTFLNSVLQKLYIIYQVKN